MKKKYLYCSKKSMNTAINPQIDESWKALLNEEFGKEYFIKLKNFLVAEKDHYPIYPPGKFIFNAFDKTPVEKVKVVILGQDPYHGAGQAHGLCFSVQTGIKPPPSLVNIFKEIHDDLGLSVPNHGNLEKWTEQGVLLLNATLTVRANMARSHFNKGWEKFTDAAIQKISEAKENLVFLLWGKDAQAKEPLINGNKHLILKAAHPSPFSAYAGFFGCKHFSKTNNYLISKNIEPVDWCL
jgi:uracil-DNA glycosylase